MSTVKLMELMNTKYIINSLTGRFTAILNDCKENGYTLDFADCKLGPKCAFILRDYYGEFPMINSTDGVLNDMLIHNCNAVTKEYDEYELLNIKNVNSISTFIDLYNNLPTGGKYKVVCGLSHILDKATLILLILSRPDIEFDIRQCASDVFDFVREVWLSENKHHDTYWELIAPNIVRRDMTDAGTFGDTDCGYMSESLFVRNRIVLPYDFGSKKIVHMDGSPIEDEWRTVAEKCLNAFSSTIKQERKKGRTIVNFLNFREEE